MTRPATSVTGQLRGTASGKPCSISAAGNSVTIACRSSAARGVNRTAAAAVHRAASSTGIRVYYAIGPFRVPVAGAHARPASVLAAMIRGVGPA